MVPPPLMFRLPRIALIICALAAVALSLMASPSTSTRSVKPAPTASSTRVAPAPLAPMPTLLPSPLGRAPVKGLTIGPIESALHPGKGYGTGPFQAALETTRALGANWIALTVFGRVASLASTEISMSFEQPFASNRKAIVRAVQQAHDKGLKVMLVPHLWVESGGWRGELEPRNGAWDSWSSAYERFVLEWARVADETEVDLFSVGVELRSWVTSTHAASFVDVIDRVRAIYKGPLTYAANWDDVNETAILGHLDVIGINAFFPLAEQPGARLPKLHENAARVAERVGELHQRFDKPILFTEIGYTNRKDPALRPWEWPDSMNNVQTSPVDQAEAFMALLAPFIEQPWFAGFFVWRVYSDPFDSSQEAEWGFSPLYREAELVLRDAFTTRWRPAVPVAHPVRLAPTPFLNLRADGLAKF